MYVNINDISLSGQARDKHIGNVETEAAFCRSLGADVNLPVALPSQVRPQQPDTHTHTKRERERATEQVSLSLFFSALFWDLR